jgi:flagellar motor switch protein FliG
MNGLVGRDTTKLLQGSDKAAALLLSIDPEIARRLLRHFDQDDLHQLAKRAAALGVVGGEALESLIGDFSDQFFSRTPDLIGAPEKAEQLLTGVIPPENVAEIMSDVIGGSNQFFWQRLSSLPINAIGSYLANEHPQTIALVMGRLDCTIAAAVLEELPGQLRNNVISRMLRSHPVTDTAIRIIEVTLQEDLLGSRSSELGPDSRSQVAEILNQMDRDHADDIFMNIESLDPAIARELKGLVFTFEDIPMLCERARALLFDKVPTDQLIMALRGADDSINLSVLPILGARVRRMVEAELAAGDTPSERDILTARRQIANTALQLRKAGVIELNAQSTPASD